MAPAIGAVGLGFKGSATRAMTGAARDPLILLGLVRRFKADSRLGVLREQSGMAEFAVVLCTLQMSGMIEYDITVFGRQHELRRRLFVLRKQRGHSQYGNEESTTEQFLHTSVRQKRRDRSMVLKVVSRFRAML